MEQTELPQAWDEPAPQLPMDHAAILTTRMRRTFNDLARVANVEALVTRSISGHLTEQMREHYSTVSPVEQRESIGRVLRLVKGGSESATSEHPDDERGTHDPSRGTHSRIAMR